MNAPRPSRLERKAPLRTLLAWLAGLVGLLVALPVAGVLLPCWLAAACTRGLDRLLRRGSVHWADLFEFDPVLGWRVKPGLDCRVGEIPFRITTDAKGWRSRKTTLAEADVVVLGDSYAFGFSVDDRHFFAERAGDLRVKAVGAAGYSMVQPVQWMRRAGSRLSGKLVVWLVYLGNDLDGSLQPSMGRYRAPFARRDPATGEWEITTWHVSPDRWPFPPKRTNYENFVEICTGGFLADRAFSACEFLVREGRDACAAAGARLVVATIPDLSPSVTVQFADIASRRGLEGAFDPGLPDRRLGEICERLGVEFVPLAEHMTERDYLRADCHWSPRGHRTLAEVVRALDGADVAVSAITPPRRPAVAAAGR